MAKAKPSSTPAEQVTNHIAQLPADIAAVVTMLRQAILEAHENVAEQIKWNNPAFCYNGDIPKFDPKEYKRDIVVFNLFKGRIMLVWPHGARLTDRHSILEGKYADGRRTIVIKDESDAVLKAPIIQELIKEWINTLDN